MPRRWKEKYFRHKRVEVEGAYCAICHKVKEQGRITSLQTTKNNHSKILIDAMSGYISDEEKIEDVYCSLVNKCVKEPSEELSLENLSEPKFDMNIEPYEELFIIKEGCKYHTKEGTKSGIMIQELERDGYDRFIK